MRREMSHDFVVARFCLSLFPCPYTDDTFHPMPMRRRFDDVANLTRVWWSPTMTQQSRQRYDPDSRKRRRELDDHSTTHCLCYKPNDLAGV